MAADGLIHELPRYFLIYFARTVRTDGLDVFEVLSTNGYEGLIYNFNGV